jgi:tetratricopeptide (TPR) repeat protein
MRFIIALVLLSAPAFAEQSPVCPAVPDHAAEKTALLRDLRIARDETDAMLITGDLWRIWTDAPDARAQDLLDRGMASLRAADYAASIATLGELVAYCPDYAEGWNQRAFAAYLSGDHTLALSDLEQALAIDPLHVAALSGKALTLIRLGRDDEAQLVLREAVHLNPWLGERALLTIPLGKDI